MYSAGQNDTRIPGSIDVPDKPGKEPQRNLTDIGAAINMLKFVIGLGIISLPEATKHIGWLPSVIGLGVVAFITVWGIFFAVQARVKMDKLEEDVREFAAARAMTEGDPLVGSGSWKDLPDSGCGFFDKIVGKVFGAPAQYLFALSIALGQFTTLVIYVNVITENFESYFPASNAHTTVLFCVISLLGLFSLIPTLQGVSILSGVGLSIYTFLFMGLIAEFLRKMQDGTLPASAVVYRMPNGSHYGQWFGASCFAFSGFPIAMVIYEEMKNPAAFQTVVKVVYVTIWFVYSCFALLGFLCYGAETRVLVYFNFPEGSAFRHGGAAALASILCFSFVVQAMPVFNCTARSWELMGLGRELGMPGLPLPLIRWSVLALTIVVAYFVPSIKLLMDTVGAISGVLAGFIFPSLTYLKLSSSDEWAARCRCLVVMGVGLTGVYCSCFGH